MAAANLNRLLFRHDWPHFYAFDVLAVDGCDVRGLPLIDRKRLLVGILPAVESRLLYLDHFAERRRDCSEWRASGISRASLRSGGMAHISPGAALRCSRSRTLSTRRWRGDVRCSRRSAIVGRHAGRRPPSCASCNAASSPGCPAKARLLTMLSARWAAPLRNRRASSENLRSPLDLRHDTKRISPPVGGARHGREPVTA